MLRRFLPLIVVLLLLSRMSSDSAAGSESGIGWIDRSFRVEMLDEGIYLGSAPRTDADFARLRQLGVRHVIDIRSLKLLASAKEARRAARFGMLYERIPAGFFPTKNGEVPSIMARLKTKAVWDDLFSLQPWKRSDRIDLRTVSS